MAVGSAVLDFGSRPTATTPGKTFASVDVTGLSGLTTGTYLDVWKQGDSTADHNADEHVAECVELVARYLTATSLRIYGFIKRGRAWGQFTVRYATKD